MATNDASNATYAYVDRVAVKGCEAWTKNNDNVTYSEEIGNSEGMLFIVYRHAGTGKNGKREYSWPTRVQLKIQHGSFQRTKGITLSPENVGTLASILAKPGVKSLVDTIAKYNADKYGGNDEAEPAPVKGGFSL